jgi:hypothetical protein
MNYFEYEIKKDASEEGTESQIFKQLECYFKTNLYASNESLNILESTFLRTKNLSFNLLGSQLRLDENSNIAKSISSGDTLKDITQYSGENFDFPTHNEFTLHTERIDLKNEDEFKKELKKNEPYRERSQNMEVTSWSGVVNLKEYAINQDLNPEIIIKKCTSDFELIQELVFRYLRPPTPPEPGEIILIQEPNILTAPAPPLVIRQQPPKPITPEPLVIREVPPPPPRNLGMKLM